jgi:hypothetical protein
LEFTNQRGNCFHRRRNDQLSRRRAAHSLTESRNANRSLTATLPTSWMPSMVAGGTRKEGSSHKKLGSDRHLVIVSPEWNYPRIISRLSENGASRSTCATLTQLTPHWRNSSPLADESECGCGVVDTSPPLGPLRKFGSLPGGGLSAQWPLNGRNARLAHVVYGMPKAARGYERLPWEHPEFACCAIRVACEGPQSRLQKTVSRASKASNRHPLFYKKRDSLIISSPLLRCFVSLLFGSFLFFPNPLRSRSHP